MAGTKKKKLLLVEDEFIIAKWTRFLLEQQNYLVEVISTGEAAVEYINTAEDIDPILMDKEDQIVKILNEQETGKNVKDIARENGISENTFFN